MPRLSDLIAARSDAQIREWIAFSAGVDKLPTAEPLLKIEKADLAFLGRP